MRIRRALLHFTVVLGLLMGMSPQLYAQSSSNSYRVEETFFGTGGEVDSVGNQFRANTSVGNIGVGESTSNAYDVYAGFVTPAEPFLEMVVMDATVDLGIFDPANYSYGAAQGGTCNCSFYVRTYLSSEYNVITVSQPPTSENGDVLNAKTVKGVPSSDPDVEEFGINVVENTSPNFGKDLSNLPDNSFADGEIHDNYNDPGEFMYGVGDIIARSQATAGRQAVGVTEYTISYIAKPNNLTPAGLYRMNHDLVVIATY